MMARHRKTSLKRSSRITSYSFKTAIFLALIAASILAISAITPVVNSDTRCEQSWFYKATAGVFGCFDAANLGAQVNSEADAEKTIWNPLAKSWLTEEQVGLLKLAYDIGYQDGGEQHASLLQSTLLQETIAGQLGRVGHRAAPVGKRSYGVMQVKVSAATDVLDEHPQLGVSHTDEELIVRLMTDDEFNIRVASKFLLFLRDKTSSDAEALVAYNMGLRASKRFEAHEDFYYVKSVNRYFESIVVPFNRKYLGHDSGIISLV
jgi:hypothetical protein